MAFGRAVAALYAGIILKNPDSPPFVDYRSTGQEIVHLRYQPDFAKFASLDHWRVYFEDYVLLDDYAMGRKPFADGKPGRMAQFKWVVSATGIADIVNRATAQESAHA